MVNLSDADGNELVADVMRRLSRDFVNTPMTKPVISSLIKTYFDNALEAAEASLMADLPNGVEKDWLLANLDLSRRMFARTADKRAETL